MQKIDIKNIQVKLPIQKLIETIDNSQEIAIDIDGNIYSNNIDSKAILIFRRNLINLTDKKDIKEKLTEIFTDDYKPQIDSEYCTIKPLIAWQEVIKINTDRMLYLDHPTDGIEVFNDTLIEDLCFEAVTLDIDYRDIADFIENSCDGKFIYYENDIQFSGFVIVDDINVIRKQIIEFLQKSIQQKINQGTLDKEQFDSEQEDAYELIFSHN